jgi:hypothetical protein
MIVLKQNIKERGRALVSGWSENYRGAKVCRISHRCGPGFETGPRHVGFVVGQSGSGQVFSEYFGFPLQSSFAPPITPQSPSYIIRGKMYNRPMCGRSTGTYTNLGDLQRDLRELSPTPPKKNGKANVSLGLIRHHARKF